MSWCTCDVFAFGLSLLLDIQGRTESRISILFLRIFLLLRVLKHVLQADLFPNQMEMSLQKLNGQPEHVCGDSNVSFGMVPFFLGATKMSGKWSLPAQAEPPNSVEYHRTPAWTGLSEETGGSARGGEQCKLKPY